ncbi:MAG TPA: gliding motility-associated C-terminal domain-containing protein, partial [Saprospiraceae bacterium]|nr:gliding motility-associated C-terminal domain-containing protein [Saprospiraceae bacterium]
IADIPNILQTSFEHVLDESIPTCYLVTAYDMLGNECLDGDTACVKYCPYYSLPNTFTPNGDGHNDIFKPYPYRFIDRIEMRIFNRWGNLVYQTDDPDINWTGTDQSGSPVSDGVYFYQCRVFYSGLQFGGPEGEQLTGFIELLRGKK